MKRLFVVALVVLLLVGLALFPVSGTGLSGLSGRKKGYNWKKVMSGKEVWKELERNGWNFKRMKGSHKIYEKNGETVSVPKNKELPRGTLNSIIKYVTFVENKK